MSIEIKSLAKDSIAYGVGIALTQFTTLLLLPFHTRFLSEIDYGMISILAFFSYIVFSIFTLGFGTSIGIVYFNVKYNQKSRQAQVISNALLILLVAGIVLFGIAIISKTTLATLLLESSQFDQYILIAVITNIFNILSLPVMLYTQFERKTALFLKNNAIAAITIIIGNIIFLFAFDLGIKGVLYADMMSKIVLFTLFFLSFSKLEKFSFANKHTKGLLKYGLPLIPSFVCLYVIQQGNTYFIKENLDLVQVGIYSVGFTLANSIQLLLSGVSAAWFPIYMGYVNKKEEARREFGNMFLYFCILVSVVSLCYYLFPGPVIELVFPDNYYVSHSYIGYISTGLFVLGMFSFFNAPLTLEKKTWMSTTSQLISALIYVLLTPYLIQKYEVLGACYSIIIAYLIMNIVAWFFNQHVEGSVKMKFDTYRLLIVLGGYSGLIMLYAVIDTFVLDYSFLLKLILMLCYLVLEFKFVLKKTERERIMDYLKNKKIY